MEPAEALPHVVYTTGPSRISRTSSNLDSLPPLPEDRLNEVRIGPEDVEWGPTLGSGNFGSVHKGRFRGELVALKRITRAQWGLRSDADLFLQEISVLALLHHPNCLSLLAVCSEPPFFVTEFMPGGSLEASLGRLSPGALLGVARDVAAAMAYLHSFRPPLVHRDLTPSNVLLGPAGAKVGDFGLARFAGEEMTQRAGKVQMMAPEVFAGRPYDHRADVYSYGLTLWTALAGRDVCPTSEAMLWAARAAEDPAFRPPPGPPAWQPLLAACWAAAPAARPSFPQILEQLAHLPPPALGPRPSPGANSGSSPGSPGPANYVQPYSDACACVQEAWAGHSHVAAALPAPARHLAASGAHVLAATASHVTIWETATAAFKTAFEPGEPISGLAYQGGLGAGGRGLVATGGPGGVRLWEAGSLGPVGQLGLAGGAAHLAWPAPTVLATVGAAVSLWAPATGQLQWAGGPPGHRLAAWPDRATLAVAGADIVIVDPGQAAPVLRLPATGPDLAVAGPYLLVAGPTAQLWDLRRPEVLPLPPQPATAAALTEAEAWLGAELVQRWALDDGGLQHRHPVPAAALLATPTHLVAADHQPTLHFITR